MTAVDFKLACNIITFAWIL